MAIDCKLESSMEGLERRLEGSITRVQEELGTQMQQFMVIFTRQNSVRVSLDFPLRERNEPILPGNRMNRGNGTSEIKVDPKEELERMMGRDREDPHNHHHSRFLMPRMEILIFERANPRWLRKCERLFEWYHIPRVQRVSLATTYFNEVMDAWFQGCLRVRREYTYEEFSKKLYERFKERSMVDTIEEFNKLRQTRSMGAYLRRFEELRSYMIGHNPHLSEAYLCQAL